ncbi:Neutral/alkaline nonlysosomal ceramidase [Stereum hirsutum FP-91666 SS1]|uniref:Neutral/alkaline nonlysosomal ceramidase n=1 Tax=Stereum hirsutum (strain FP-91666) TaxID=721885 RepID=UPI000444A2A1|nr:Neutral/alkaline nonlysosomal ceramidase [Stereum hirsutum FP-91666 SS1]EIM80776.1 Neutral/alkaline nonlysosomal ceramidase [Stereum hirsutum FP-91666 SS1]
MPLLQSYIAPPLARDIALAMRSFIQDFTNRAVFCLGAFLASTSLLSDGSQTTMGIAAVNAQTQYLLGLGIGDITGPVVETNMMGYASLAQTDTGLYMRQRSRAWIVADSSNSSNRVVMINADIAMGDTGIRRSIVANLSATYPDLYNNANIALISTHQHSGVGGYLENLLPQITSLGYVKETADAIVAGTVKAVLMAHDSLAPGTLSVGNATVVDGNRNRSPSAYLANPADERALYEYDQDKDLSLLKFDDADGNARGFLSFFAVHGTSLYENNTLVSGDNKGMAAYLYEAMEQPDVMPGNNTFVAGFTQSNVGDTSPNTLGAYCESPGESYDGMLCEFNTSTCGGATEDCHGRGPAFEISDFASNMIIAQLQVDGAQAIMNGTASTAPIEGNVRAVHTYLNMTWHTFTLPNGTTVQTCPPAMGYSFAGGTTDGPGAFDFTQGDNSSQPQNPFWEIVKGAITPFPDAEQVACQDPKPVILNTGYAHTPYNWSPGTVDIQMFRIGQFVMLIMPGELTTMSGRRMRNAIRTQLIANGIVGDDAYVVIAGPANTYAHYVATQEEYGVQRYEGASTIFGQWTLDAYIDKYGSLVSYLADNATGAQPPSDEAPPDLTGEAISLRTGVVFDSAPLFKSFGDVVADVQSSYTSGETVFAQFIGANPRNNFRLEQTFLSVDQDVDGAWTMVRSDSHPSTTYNWTRVDTITGTSNVDITWTIEDGTPAGTYRIQYFGDAKAIGGTITPFVGTSSNFTVS